jgi:hypothetical protein
MMVWQCARIKPIVESCHPNTFAVTNRHLFSQTRALTGMDLALKYRMQHLEEDKSNE